MNKDTKNTPSKKAHKRQMHRVLAHSYTTYLILFLVGVYFDFIFQIKVFPDSIMVPTGFALLIFASVIIIWAQFSTRNLRKITEVKMEHFSTGPYYYTQFPTQLGLLMLMLGFGIITNAFFVMLSTLIAFIISKFIFIIRYEKALIERYGDAYVKYKGKVKF